MRFAASIVGLLVLSGPLAAQLAPPPAPWRGAGPTPCVLPDGGFYKCPPAPKTIAIRAGHLLDTNTGKLLENQVIIIQGERIAELGAEGSVKIPAGAETIDLRRATVLPGLIDAHTHMFNTRGPKTTTEQAMLIAVQNAQADLKAGITSARDMSTHGNGYADVEIRDAIRLGRIDGPRYQVATRGIVWAGASNAKPGNPLEAAVVRNPEDARAAVQDQVQHGADWIKLYPTGGYSFSPEGKDQYQVTYPLPVLQSLIDEAHRLGRKAACHVYGGEGQRNAIVAGCDTIEHAFGLNREDADLMASKHLYYDPTLVRYTEPYMDDNDEKNTRGKYRIIPLFEKAAALGAATPGIKVMMGSGVDGSTFPHGAQALEFEWLVKRAGLTPLRAIQAGTVVNAEAMGWSKDVGSLDTGKYADIVAVAGNPLTDITELQRVIFVMKGGKVSR